MIFFIFFHFSLLENSNLMAGSCFKKHLRLVVCKTSFYLLTFQLGIKTPFDYTGCHKNGWQNIVAFLRLEGYG